MSFRLRTPDLVLPDWHGQPAQQIAGDKLGRQILPSTPTVRGLLKGDALIALAADDPLCVALGRELKLRWPRLGAAGLAILPRPKEGQLFVLGADKRGLLCGLTRVIQIGRPLADKSFEWTHGRLVEQTLLPLNYYWTWDHSTNWHLTANQQQEFGCNNAYTKTADDFIQDYQLMVDQCVRVNVGGIVIWGFCRDAHGGVAASQEICDYAADRGIRIMPGVGTSGYGGVYYGFDHDVDDSSHPLTAKNFVRTHPGAARVEKNGARSKLTPCPTHPLTVSWLRECAQWLFGAFRIGGVNVEHGDFFVCRCARCARARRGQKQMASFATMTLANQPFIDESLRLQPQAWITYATYTGFVPETHSPQDIHDMEKNYSVPPWRLGCARPEFAHDLDRRSIAQWTLSHMVNERSQPLATWLDDGEAPGLSASGHWPAKIKPVTRRNAGLLHQGSQWDWMNGSPCPAGLRPRHSLIVSCIEEACLRAVEAGLEGVSIMAEVSPRCVQADINYRAHGYFSCRPNASLRKFGRESLGPILGSDADGERYVELLAMAEAGTCAQAQLNEIDEKSRRCETATTVRGAAVTPWRYWRWLRVAAAPGQWEAAQVYQVTA